jgi:predicted dehydrogenase
MKKNLFLIAVFVGFLNAQSMENSIKTEPLKLGVIGLSHAHVGWILNRQKQDDIKMIAIVESNHDLAERYSKQFGFSMDIVFDSINEMINTVHPDAVSAFGSIYDHLKVVKTCAPKGIHVMVEKPLAVNLEHAKKMKALADKYNIHLITNYETSWYATNKKAFDMVQNGAIGDLRKVVVHDGHQGPVEIGCNQEFLDWLTDPILNGGGALTDFGCYGANLITWLTNGQRPESITAVTQTIKPDIYSRVDDEATIVLKYAEMQGVIQASWNWPFSRKDMEVYGKTGYIISENRYDLRYRLDERDAEKKEKLGERKAPYDDPFALFAAVISGEIDLPPYDVYSLENNIQVVEILDAAKESARTGKTIKLQ